MHLGAVLTTDLLYIYITLFICVLYSFEKDGKGLLIV